MPTGSLQTTDRSEALVWDVVTTDSGNPLIARVPWWIPVACIVVPASVIAIQWMKDPDANSPLMTLMIVAGTIGVAVCLAVDLQSRRWRRRLDLLDRQPAANLQDLAWRLWHRSLIRDGSGGCFDSAKWIEHTGPQGPRIVCVNLPPPPAPTLKDVYEEVPIGLDRRLGRDERAWRIFQAVSICLAGAVGIWAWSPSLASPTPGAFAFVPTAVVVCCIAVYRLGFRPLMLGRSSAVIGEIRVAAAVEPTVFSRENSVLVLHGVHSRVEAFVVRADGARKRFQFHHVSNDPGLADLIGRWSFRTEPTSTPDGQT